MDLEPIESIENMIDVLIIKQSMAAIPLSIQHLT